MTGVDHVPAALDRAQLAPSVPLAAALDRRGRRTAFLTAAAQVDGVVVARAQITTTVVPSA